MRHTYPYSQWSFYETRLSYSQKEFVSNRNSGTGVDPVATNANKAAAKGRGR